MMRKVPLYAFLVLPLMLQPVSAAASYEASLIEKQFASLDSSLTRLSELPEVRMKEVAPFDGVTKQVLAAHPEIATVLRTNSKGTVVNCTRRANGESMLHADVSAQQWYSVPKQGSGPFYGPLRKENGRTFCVWSRPLTINMPIGGSRFGGVVAISLDITACLNRFAQTMRGPFQIMLDGKNFYYISWKEGLAFDETPLNLPGNLHFTLRIPRQATAVTQGVANGGEVKVAAAASAQGAKVPSSGVLQARDASGKQEVSTAGEKPSAIEQQAFPDTVPDYVSGRTRGGALSTFLRIAGIIAVVLVAFCLWLIISTLRHRQSVQQPLISVSAPLSAVSPDAPLPEEPLAAAEIVKSEDETPSEQVPSFADIPDFLRTAPPQGIDEPPAGVEPLPNEMPPVPVQEKYSGTPSADGQEIRDGAAWRVQDEIVEEMRAETRAKITDDQRAEIYKKELDVVAAAIRKQIIDNEMTGLIEKLRKQLAEEIHRHVAQTMSAEVEEQERKNVAKEAAEKIRAEEYDAIVRTEREKLSESVRTMLAEEETAHFTAEAQEKLSAEISRAVRDNEEYVIRVRVREELAAEVRSELLEKEKDRIAAEQLQKVEAELYSDVSQERREAIRDAVVAKITEEEHQRAESGLRETIIENERKRIIVEESGEMHRQIREQIRDGEIEEMRRTVRDEIYAETVQAIKQNLEEKYQTAVEEKMADIKASLQKKIRTDIGASIKEDYDRLMEHIDRLSASLTNIEALQSLSQTVTLLTDEKKKYKYLNLNTAQTESLLEYLRRVNSRFNIYFDRVDESVRELMLNLSSVKNKLDANG
jgi:hypothetical protein